MKKYSKLLKKFLLLTTPVIASSVLFSTASQAATFAYSDGNVAFTDFSQSPSNVVTDRSTETLTLDVDGGGTVGAIAEAQAYFLIEPAVAVNSSLSAAFGQNQDYLGVAESEASVIGNFDVDANTNFSFDFFSNLELATSIDDSPKEKARVSGDISFALIDRESNDVLDFFNVVGNITTQGDNDFVAFQKSDNVTINQKFGAPGFGGLQEFLTVSIEGSLQRFFTNETSFSLVELKRNRARVTAPEPSSTLAFLLCSGFIGVALKRRHK